MAKGKKNRKQGSHYETVAMNPNVKAPEAHKRVPLDPETLKLMRAQMDAFRQKFGRDPRPEDPIFFDPKAGTPVPPPKQEIRRQWEMICKKAEEAGIAPALVYAMRKTGRIVSKVNAKHLKPEEIEEWKAAVREYEEGKADPDAGHARLDEEEEVDDDSTPGHMGRALVYILDAAMAKQMTHVTNAYTGSPHVAAIVAIYVTCPDEVAIELQQAVDETIGELLNRHGIRAEIPTIN
jgi:hypothetical protein